MDLSCFCSVLCLLCLCARLFICALGSPAGKGLTSWLSFVVSTMSLSLSHWYHGSGVVLDCIDSDLCTLTFFADRTYHIVGNLMSWLKYANQPTFFSWREDCSTRKDTQHYSTQHYTTNLDYTTLYKIVWETKRS